jgi:cytochrome c oxidase assembly protein subunit 15
MSGATHPSTAHPTPAWLRYVAFALCLATLCLIFFGGQVKSHEAGLSVPDWPLTYGENPVTFGISKWTGGIFHEHFHRLFAGGVALLTVALAVLLYLKEQRIWMVLLGIGAVATVLLQAFLGGLTVWYQLPVLVSSAHAILAQTFFLITIAIAYGLSKERARRVERVDHGAPEIRTPVKAAALMLIAAIYGQLFLGALMRHSESGLAIPDFPTTAGKVVPQLNDDTLAWINDWRFEHTDSLGAPLPDVSMGQVAIHLAHRAGAVVVTLLILGTAGLAWKRRQSHPALWHTALWLTALVSLQVTLGALTVWTTKHPYITSAHVALGAAVLGLTFLLALRSWPIKFQESNAAVEGRQGTLDPAVT